MVLAIFLKIANSRAAARKTEGIGFCRFFVGFKFGEIRQQRLFIGKIASVSVSRIKHSLISIERFL